MEYRNKFKNYKDYLAYVKEAGEDEDEVIKRFVRLGSGSFLDLTSKSIQGLSFEDAHDYWGECTNCYFCIKFPKGEVNIDEFEWDETRDTIEELFEPNDILAVLTNKKELETKRKNGGLCWPKYKYIVLTKQNIKKINFNRDGSILYTRNSDKGWKKALIRYSNCWHRVSPYNR